MGRTPPPEALLPTYSSGIDDPIVLFEGEGSLSCPGKMMKGECTIAFTWGPNQGPELTFRGSEVIHGHEYQLEVPKLGLKAHIVGRQIINGAGGPMLKGLLNGKIELGSRQPIKRVEFHLGNFPSVHGEWISWGTLESAGRIRLSSEHWEIIIDQVQNNPTVGEKGLWESLSDAQGYGITHVGALTRLDGAEFTLEEAEHVLTDVSRTLSFARGAFSCPFLRIGFNDRNERVWQSWSGYRTDAWSNNSNWFSPHHPQILNAVFQGWRQLRSSPNLEVINAASHLYLDSHVPLLATETKLIIAQAAIEGLANDWPFPMPAGSVLPGAVTQTQAAGKIATIALSLGLNLDVPSELKELKTMPNPNPASSAPEKITWIRNSVAHLGNLPRMAGVSWESKYQALQVAEHYLELALLRLLDVKGDYLNRCKVGSIGDVELLPWL